MISDPNGNSQDIAKSNFKAQIQVIRTPRLLDEK